MADGRPQTKNEARIEELEGLLRETTRRLEATERKLAVADAEVERLDVLLEIDGEDTPTPMALRAPHLAAVETAIERLAGLLRDDVTDHDDLWIVEGDQRETRIEVLADAIDTLATAHLRLAPKPPPSPSPLVR